MHKQAQQKAIRRGLRRPEQGGSASRLYLILLYSLRDTLIRSCCEEPVPGEQQLISQDEFKTKLILKYRHFHAIVFS